MLEQPAGCKEERIVFGSKLEAILESSRWFGWETQVEKAESGWAITMREEGSALTDGWKWLKEA